MWTKTLKKNLIFTKISNEYIKPYFKSMPNNNDIFGMDLVSLKARLLERQLDDKNDKDINDESHYSPIFVVDHIG